METNAGEYKVNYVGDDLGYAEDLINQLPPELQSPKAQASLRAYAEHYYGCVFSEATVPTRPDTEK